MFWEVIFILASFIGIYILFKLERKAKGVLRRNSGQTKSAKSVAVPKHIQYVGKGGMLTLSNIGPEDSTLDVLILERHRYEEDGYIWYELEGITGEQEEKIWISFAEESSWEVSVVLEKRRLQEVEMKEATPVSKEYLEEVWARRRGSVTFKDKHFKFREAGDASFLRNEDKRQKQGFRYWEFATVNQKYVLTIERWDMDKSIDVFYSEVLAETQVEILNLSDSQNS